jgi:hypothetical protein
MNTKLVGRTIQVFVEYKQIFQNDKERNEQISDLAQYYIERFNDAVKPQQ